MSIELTLATSIFLFYTIHMCGQLNAQVQLPCPSSELYEIASKAAEDSGGYSVKEYKKSNYWSEFIAVYSYGYGIGSHWKVGYLAVNCEGKIFYLSGPMRSEIKELLTYLSSEKGVVISEQFADFYLRIVLGIEEEKFSVVNDDNIHDVKRKWCCITSTSIDVIEGVFSNLTRIRFYTVSNNDEESIFINELIITDAHDIAYRSIELPSCE